MTDIDAPQPPSPDEMEEVFDALDDAISRLQEHGDAPVPDDADDSTDSMPIP